MPFPADMLVDPVFATLGALVVGLCVGSFLNVVIHRLPKMLERGWHEQRLGRFWGWQRLFPGGFHRSMAIGKAFAFR